MATLVKACLDEARLRKLFATDAIGQFAGFPNQGRGELPNFGHKRMLGGVSGQPSRASRRQPSNHRRRGGHFQARRPGGVRWLLRRELVGGKEKFTHGRNVLPRSASLAGFTMVATPYKCPVNFARIRIDGLRVYPDSARDAPIRG